MPIRLGYACINMELQSQKPRVFTGRKMIKRTFAARGIEYASQLAVQNAKDLKTIITWNNDNGFSLFRISSCLIPWVSEFELEEMPDYEEFANILSECGELARSHNQRLSFHPGHFTILTSKKENVVENSIKELEYHSQLFDLMGYPADRNTKINIHIGASYGDRESAIERWLKNYDLLSPNAKARLTVENDDKARLFSVKDLYHGIYKNCGVSIVFDYHHHKFRDDGMNEEEALEMAMESWPKGIKPTCHYSESANWQEGRKVNPTAHSDYIYKKINDYGKDLDIMVECKAKELGVKKAKEDFPGYYVS